MKYLLRKSWPGILSTYIFGKIDFSQYFLQWISLARPPMFNVGFDFLELLAEQETFLEPTIATLGWRGREGVIFNWKEKGRGHFESLENGLLSYKPMLWSWSEAKLCWKSIKPGKSVYKVSYIVNVHYMKSSQSIFWEDCLKREKDFILLFS